MKMSNVLTAKATGQIRLIFIRKSMTSLFIFNKCINMYPSDNLLAPELKIPQYP